MESNSQTDFHEIITEQKELDALKNFKNSLATITTDNKKYITVEVLTNNDLLIHFLRARKLNIKKAQEMILKYLKWYIDYNVDDIYKNFQLENFEFFKQIYLHSYHKTSKEGYPIYIQVIGNVNIDALDKNYTHELLIKYSAKLYESNDRLYFPICSKVANKYIHGLFTIIDMKNLSNKILSKKFYNFVKSNLEVCQDYYPECLYEACIINCGFLFKALFTVVKPFLDSKTKSRVKVYGNDYKNYLLSKIDKENLPKLYGGECECKSPGGCFFSGAGPWKTTEDEPVSKEVAEQRIRAVNKCFFGKEVIEEKKEDKKETEEEKKNEK